MMTRRDLLAVPALGLVSRFVPPALGQDDADPTRVFTGAAKPTDVRLGPPKTLNDDFPFAVPKTKEAWEARRRQVREQVLVANGLWPLPEKTPLNPVIHGKIDKGLYSIEKVYFESTPGHYVTGNLYRPNTRDSASSPGVLFAHGHWAGGRFEDAGEKAGKASVDAGGEPDMDRGRFFMQALPATLARMGFVVFQYDMVGYADSKAIPHREGFRDAEAELRLQSFMGLQTWNSIRALDFLASLPDVDAKRIGMTGASGGGTQTFILAAIDDRLAAAFPAVMVSTAMQGGCVCENCSHLRVNTGNVEMAAVFAPKPLAMSAANDWTKDIMTKGFPELKQLYALYGAEDKVAARAWLEYGHQYNVHAREFMYSWFRKHLEGKDEKVTEPPFKPVVPVTGLSVFDAEHPRPKNELNAAQLRAALAKASDAQLKALEPKDAKSLTEFKRVVGTALRVMVNSEIPPTNHVKMWVGTSGRLKPGGFEVNGGVIYRARPEALNAEPDLNDVGEGDAVPFIWGKPSKEAAGIVLWVHPKGKASLFDKGEWVPAAKLLLDRGYHITAIDTLGTGEQIAPKPFPVDKNYAGYTYGYNRSLLANRVRDVLTALSNNGFRGKGTMLVGFGEMGPVAVLAKALAGDAVAKTAADLNQFRFEAVADVADPMMLPGAVKYGGLDAFL
ncbi:MAG: acetylxylan esterase, partial [Gemmataceae bacterium]|nr:acetylxylan esterase [Gemmataceae bacterium]